MAEHVLSLDQENKHEINNGLEKQEINEDSPNLDNTFPFAGLNLFLILSFLSLSSEECLNLDEKIQETKVQDLEHKSKPGSCFVPRRREISHIQAVGRQSSKVNTKIRDFRHCRRM
ncbi:Ypt/Rab-GAP domain of gyp1p superfamily protein [Striga asiatica]|uniref:Ypt/Rab-GAP domain of gyp1p superfamily protein n=1 Tax=Striga asiatica TaxID=4170 RepID=A0A5A7PZA6_STRAF|nr:Ypt/Rab-GAP domain of gyp1p superfamily protein [Striga asiatica]